MKMKTKEIAQLIKSARDGATGSSMKLGELLRVCMRLGSELSNDELVAWSRKETSGYGSDDELPDYRIVPSEVRGTFHGPFGSAIKNTQIPKSAIDKEHRDSLFTIRLREPASQLEAYSLQAGDNSMMSIHWSGDAIAYYQNKELYSNGMVLASAWNPISAQHFAGIIDTIRTRVLDFMIQIEKELDIDVDEPDASSPRENISPQHVTNIFNNTIQGQNIAMSNSGDVANTNINIQQGNLEDLTKYLRSLGVSLKELEELKTAIEEDPLKPKNTLGPKVSTWLSKLSIKGLKGGLSVAKDVAANLLAEAIMRYYGIK